MDVQLGGAKVWDVSIYARKFGNQKRLTSSRLVLFCAFGTCVGGFDDAQGGDAAELSEVIGKQCEEATTEI